MIINKKNRRLLKKITSKILLKNQKQVIEIPEQARFGNILYFFLHCYIEREKNNNVFILYTKTMDYWLTHFPKLNAFILNPNEFKRYDNKDWFVEYYQIFGTDFTEIKLNEFIDTYILSSNYFNENKNNTVINIRRGDFYEKGKILPANFDQLKFLEIVIQKYPTIFNNLIEIVSDDVKWCEENLSNILKEHCTGKIQYNYESNPFEDFVSICTAKNLIINNSTFSYWGGYINSRLRNDHNVISPNFGATFYKDSIAVQLHPDWKIIEI